MSDSAGDGGRTGVECLEVVAQVEGEDEEVRRLLDRGLRYPSRQVRRVAAEL